MKLNLFFPLLLLKTTLLFATSYHVDRNHPNASDTGPGTAENPFMTINKAAQIAVAGDSVIVHEGIYRERVSPLNDGFLLNPVVYTAAAGENVVIKGSDVYTGNWSNISGNVSSTILSDDFFGDYNPFRRLLERVKNIPGREAGDTLTLGQFFVDGMHYREMAYASEVDTAEGSWHYDWDSRKLKVNFLSDVDPASAFIEITTRERIFAPYTRGLGFIHVKGFTMEHCGNQFPSGFWSKAENAQAGALGTSSGHHWEIMNNTIRWAKNIGMDIASETSETLNGQSTPDIINVGYHLVENNHISDCGACGIAGYKSFKSQIRGNRIERMNYLNHTAPETGGMKFHFFFQGLIEGNVFVDNYCKGIWLDNQYKDSRVSRNIIINSKEMGIFVEMGFGPVLVDNNIIAYTKPGNYAPDPKGDGFYTHDASGITFVHNLVFGGEEFGAYMRIVTNRKVNNRLVEASDLYLLNNIFTNNASGNIMLPFPGSRAKNNMSNANLVDTSGIFVISTYGGNHPYDGMTRMPLLESTLADNCPEAEAERWTDRENRAPFSDQQYGLILELEEWKCMMAYGMNSYPSDTSGLSLDKNSLDLSITLGSSPWRISCPSIPGTDVDFFGNPLGENPMPGPFQGLIPSDVIINLNNEALADSFNLSINRSGEGIVNTDEEGTKFPYGKAVLLSAVPDPGYRFTGWTGDAELDVNPLRIGFYKDMNITATFEKLEGYNINIEDLVNGSITLDPSLEVYPAGSNVTITAIPDDGFEFSGWGGDITGQINPFSVTMDKNFTISADFSIVGSALVTEEPEIKVFPNPAGEFININFRDQSSFNVELLDLTGRIIVSGKSAGAETQIKIPPAHKGVYLLRLFYEDGVITRKIILNN